MSLRFPPVNVTASDTPAAPTSKWCLSRFEHGQASLEARMWFESTTPRD